MTDLLLRCSSAGDPSRTLRGTLADGCLLMAGDWIEFPLAPGERAAYEVTRVLWEGRTRFQEVRIVETRPYGLALFLDGAPQSALADEFVYHEALVHPALVAHPSPRRVLIAGGGEGATLREVLRHPSVEQATMVDIDGELIDFCREHLADWHQGAFDDRRASLIVGDAKKYLAETDRRFDVIIADLTDPIEEGLASLLYTRQFYELLKPRLAGQGIFVTQALGIRYNRMDVLHAAVHSTLRALFREVASYTEFLITFDSLWAFATASDSLRPADLTPDEVDRRLAERGLSDLRYYDGVTHRRMFSLPKHLRRTIAESTKIIEENEPIAVEW